MKQLLPCRRCANDVGATTVEYALVIGLVSLVVIAGPIGLGVNFGDYVDDLVGTVGGLLGGA